MNLFKTGAAICVATLIFLSVFIATNQQEPQTPVSIQDNLDINFNDQLDKIFTRIEAGNKPENRTQYLVPAEGRVFSWWPANEELNYDDLYTVINFVLDKSPVDIPDKAGFISLLIETIATESFFGSTNVQRHGSAKGVIQCEPATLQCLYDNFFKYNPEYKRFVDQFRDVKMTNLENLKVNLQYQIAVATMCYIRKDGHIRSLATIEDRYAVYKAIYNTPLGKATQAIYELNIEKYLKEHYPEV